MYLPQKECIECYKRETEKITFPGKLADAETLTNNEVEKNQVVFEEETLSHACKN